MGKSNLKIENEKLYQKNQQNQPTQSISLGLNDFRKNQQKRPATLIRIPHYPCTLVVVAAIVVVAVAVAVAVVVVAVYWLLFVVCV